MILLMADRSGSRIVYSTDAGRICPTCGCSATGCRCSAGHLVDEPVPVRIVAKLRVEKKGRAGKTVTVVDGLPRNGTFLKELSQALKRACGTGGTVVGGAVELQGDLRDRARAALTKRGYIVKG
jgi:translation initiation factor 1